jgi:5,10-methenyltetrahydromethanopterin hydrogenase
MTPTKKHRDIVSDIVGALADYPNELRDEVASDMIQMLKDADGLSNLDADVIISMLWARGY